MTRCDIGGRRNWWNVVIFGGCAALAAAVVLAGASSARAQGLKYVDGLPAAGGPLSVNLFQSNGSALTLAQLNPDTRIDNDNAWGWRDFGATNTDSFFDPTPGTVDLDYASIYESTGNTAAEDSPEIQMRLTGADGIAASTAYDVYIAYWADMGGNWGIRGGLAPGTVEAPLQAFANFNTTDAGDMPGIFASSGAWDMPPLDNPTDDNTGTAGMDGGPSDNNTNPFLDFTPGGPATSARNMLLGYLGSVTSGTQPGAAANEIRVWIDDLPAGVGGAGRRSWFDGLAFVPAGTNVFWDAALDRDQRTLTVTNNTTQSFTIVGYSILSEAGSLNGSGVNNAPWNNLTAGTLPGFTDTDNDWTVVGTPTDLSPELREEDGGVLASTGAQDGIVVNPGGELSFGALWQLAPFEDVQIVLRLADGTPETFDDNPTVLIPSPVYSGTEAVRGDFTGDGEIDIDDYIVLMQNLHKPQGTLTRTQYYRNGDINDTNAVNRDDWYGFRAAYFQANPGAGAGGFAAMLAEAAEILGRGAVPEPSTLLLALLGGGFLCTRSRRRRGDLSSTPFVNKDFASTNDGGNFPRRLGAAILALIVGCLLATSAQAVPVTGWQCDMSIGNCDNDLQLSQTDTNSPIVGNGTAESADDFTIWGSTPNIMLTDGFEAVLSGRVRFTGASATNGREFRWGMWKDKGGPGGNGDPDETHSWLGYLAAGGGGATPGRLYVRNPDSGDFRDASFISTAGDTSVGTSSGPCPEAGCGSQFVDHNNEGTSPGRYFLLAETPVTNNAAFTAADGLWYNFEIRVGAYGQEVTSSGRLFTDAQPAIGDFNNDNRVDAGDYVRWRNNLGNPATTLSNRGANPATTVDVTHYADWKANYGSTGSAPAYDLRMGGGLDFDGNPPPLINQETMMPNEFTDHLTFEFDRVGFLMGNVLNADQVNFENIDISTNQIQTINLHVNTATGDVHIRNLLGTPFDINYYEITSTLGVLESDNWESFDAADGGLPVTNDYLTGWDVAEGSLTNGDFVLSEGNFVGSTLVSMGSPIYIGDVFKTATPLANRDIRFFVGTTGGDVVRGTITYDTNPPGGGGLAVPEPATVALVLVALGAMAGSRVGGRTRPV